MEVQSWNKELILANAQFKRLFNNIVIEKGNKKTKFYCVLGNRSRILKHLENPEKDSMYKLPLIIIQRTGITKNNDRLANVNNEIKYSTHSSKLNYNLYTPVPIDISYEVTIVSKYQEHIDKAVSNFIPFFNKDLYVRCQHPKFEGLSFTNQVVMEDNIQEDHPDEIDPSQDDIVTATCSFTFKTYMFCGNQKAETVTKTYVKEEIKEETKVEHYSGLSTTVRKLSETEKQNINEYLSNDISIVYRLTEEDKQNIDKYLSCDMSAMLSSYVDMDISNTISNKVSVEISVDETSGFVPQINQMYVGFIPVPVLCQYIDYFNWVDSIPSTVIKYGETTSAKYDPYIDVFHWTFDENPISDY